MNCSDCGTPFEISSLKSCSICISSLKSCSICGSEICVDCKEENYMVEFKDKTFCRKCYKLVNSFSSMYIIELFDEFNHKFYLGGGFGNISQDIEDADTFCSEEEALMWYAKTVRSDYPTMVDKCGKRFFIRRLWELLI